MLAGRGNSIMGGNTTSQSFYKRQVSILGVKKGIPDENGRLSPTSNPIAKLLVTSN